MDCAGSIRDGEGNETSVLVQNGNWGWYTLESCEEDLQFGKIFIVFG